ncbi:MAG: hypothetical protein J7L43_02305, partial [Candidatus Aenigmarchaeota archaeon]|nr:hypothetical protein [Candidatus Aenigmarchaeota archaeon]
LYTSNRFLMIEFLKSHEIETPKVFLINSRKALLRMKNIKMPLVIRSSEEKGIMFATNKTELKTMVDSLGYSSPICIEEFYSRTYSQILVIGREVFGIQRKPKEKKDIYLGRGSAKKKKLNSDEKTIALKVANALNTDFLLVTVGSKKVYDVSLYPNLVEISQILGTDVIHKLLNFIKVSITGEEVSVEKMKYDIKRLILDIFK